MQPAIGNRLADGAVEMDRPAKLRIQPAATDELDSMLVIPSTVENCACSWMKD